MQAGIVQFREQRGTDFQEIKWNIWMWKKVKIQGFWLGKYEGLFFFNAWDLKKVQWEVFRQES